MNNGIFIAAFLDEMEKMASCDHAFWSAFTDEMEKIGIWPRRPRTRKKMQFELKGREGQPDVSLGSGRRTLREHPSGPKGRLKKFISPGESPVLRLLGKIPTREVKGGKRVTLGGKAKRALSRLTGRKRKRRAARRTERMEREGKEFKAIASMLSPTVRTQEKMRTAAGATGTTAEERLQETAKRVAKRRVEQSKRLEAVAGKKKPKLLKRLLAGTKAGRKKIEARMEGRLLAIEGRRKALHEHKLKTLQKKKGKLEAPIKALQERYKPIAPGKGKQKQKQKQEQGSGQQQQQQQRQPEPATASA